MRRSAKIAGLIVLAVALIALLFEVVFPWVDALIDDPAVEPQEQPSAVQSLW